MLKRRAGFTLVELLIVIILIGILAGAMMLAGASGTDKAEAAKVMNNLQKLKAAAFMIYVDEPSIPKFEYNGRLASLDAYIDRKVGGNPDYAMISNSDDVYVGMKVKTAGSARKLDRTELLYFNTTGSFPTSADLVPPREPDSPGWAFLKVF